MPTQMRFGGSTSPGSRVLQGKTGEVSLSLPSLPAATTNRVLWWSASTVASRSLMSCLRSEASQGSVPKEATTMSTPSAPAKSKASTTASIEPPPQLSSVRSGRIVAPGATPEMPKSLLRTAAIVPATCVPWSVMDRGRGLVAVAGSREVRHVGAPLDPLVEVRMVSLGGDLRVRARRS